MAKSQVKEKKSVANEATAPKIKAATKKKTEAETKIKPKVKKISQTEINKKEDTPQVVSKAKAKKIEIPKKMIKLKEGVMTPDIEPQIIIPLDEKIDAKKAEDARAQVSVDKMEDLPVRYSDEDLAMFQAVVEANRMEALDELRMLKERLEDLNSSDLAEESMVYSVHMGEQGSEAIEKEKIYAQIQRITEYIQKLNEAMTRIENKTYGICRVCSCLIAKERLLAVPITTLSASYKIHQKCPVDGIDRIEARKL